MSIYIPTYLYIKQHNLTGLKYFGKTAKADPFKYKGSGTYWLRHLKKHGNNVSTIWCQLFEDKSSLIEYALQFSKENNIVESTDWANLHQENGIDGAVPGRILPKSTKQKISNSLKGISTPGKMTDAGRKSLSEFMKEEHKRKPRLSMLNKTHSKESKDKNAESNRNRPRFKCPYCKIKCQQGTYTRWHGNNCKLNIFQEPNVERTFKCQDPSTIPA